MKFMYNMKYLDKVEEEMYASCMNNIEYVYFVYIYMLKHVISVLSCPTYLILQLFLFFFFSFYLLIYSIILSFYTFVFYFIFLSSSSIYYFFQNIYSFFYLFIFIC